MIVKQILIIDDEDDIRKLTQTCLEIMGGWQVLTASSASEGLAKAQSEHPDAILLDFMMSSIEGLTTLQKLQANPATKHIPVILFTPKGYFADKSLLAELGVKSRISKPFNPMELADQVAAALS